MSSESSRVICPQDREIFYEAELNEMNITLKFRQRLAKTLEEYCKLHCQLQCQVKAGGERGKVGISILHQIISEDKDDLDRDIKENLG